MISQWAAGEEVTPCETDRLGTIIDIIEKVGEQVRSNPKYRKYWKFIDRLSGAQWKGFKTNDYEGTFYSVRQDVSWHDERLLLIAIYESAAQEEGGVERNISVPFNTEDGHLYIIHSGEMRKDYGIWPEPANVVSASITSMFDYWSALHDMIVHVPTYAPEFVLHGNDDVPVQDAPYYVSLIRDEIWDDIVDWIENTDEEPIRSDREGFKYQFSKSDFDWESIRGSWYVHDKSEPTLTTALLDTVFVDIIEHLAHKRMGIDLNWDKPSSSNNTEWLYKTIPINSDLVDMFRIEDREGMVPKKDIPKLNSYWKYLYDYVHDTIPEFAKEFVLHSQDSSVSPAEKHRNIQILHANDSVTDKWQDLKWGDIVEYWLMGKPDEKWYGVITNVTGIWSIHGIWDDEKWKAIGRFKEIPTEILKENGSWYDATPEFIEKYGQRAHHTGFMVATDSTFKRIGHIDDLIPEYTEEFVLASDSIDNDIMAAVSRVEYNVRSMIPKNIFKKYWNFDSYFIAGTEGDKYGVLFYIPDSSEPYKFRGAALLYPAMLEMYALRRAGIGLPNVQTTWRGLELRKNIEYRKHHGILLREYIAALASDKETLLEYWKLLGDISSSQVPTYAQEFVLSADDRDAVWYAKEIASMFSKEMFQVARELRDADDIMPYPNMSIAKDWTTFRGGIQKDFYFIFNEDAPNVNSFGAIVEYVAHAKLGLDKTEFTDLSNLPLSIGYNKELRAKFGILGPKLRTYTPTNVEGAALSETELNRYWEYLYDRLSETIPTYADEFVLHADEKKVYYDRIDYLDDGIDVHIIGAPDFFFDWSSLRYSMANNLLNLGCWYMHKSGMDVECFDEDGNNVGMFNIDENMEEFLKLYNLYKKVNTVPTYSKNFVLHSTNVQVKAKPERRTCNGDVLQDSSVSPAEKHRNIQRMNGEAISVMHFNNARVKAKEVQASSSDLRSSSVASRDFSGIAYGEPSEYSKNDEIRDFILHSNNARVKAKPDRMAYNLHAGGVIGYMKVNTERNQFEFCIAQSQLGPANEVIGKDGTEYYTIGIQPQMMRAVLDTGLDIPVYASSKTSGAL